MRHDEKDTNNLRLAQDIFDEKSRIARSGGGLGVAPHSKKYPSPKNQNSIGEEYITLLIITAIKIPRIYHCFYVKVRNLLKSGLKSFLERSSAASYKLEV
jgi:hypothetical protein